MLKLGELLIGICAKSRKQEYFEVFDDLPEKESNEIFRVLSELIPLEEEKEANKSKSQDGIKEKNEEWIHLMEEVEDLRNENAMLWIRAENAEKENERLNHEMNELTEKVTELTKSNYTLELNFKETEAKYQELVSSLKREETETKKRRGSDFNLSIKYLLPNLIFINFINPFFIFNCLANSFFSFNLSWICLQNLWIILALSLHCIFLTILSHFIKVLYNLLLVIFSFFNKYIISNFLIFNNLSFSFLALYPL